MTATFHSRNNKRISHAAQPPGVCTRLPITYTKKAPVTRGSFEIVTGGLLGRDGCDLGLFLHERRTLAEALAEVGQLGAADVAMALDLDLVDAR